MTNNQFAVNPHTGEILGEYTVGDVTPMNTKDKQFYKYTAIVPELATHVDDVTDYMSVYVDKRKLVTHNSITELHNLACGTAKRTGTKALFTMPQLKIIQKLSKLVVYRNIVIGSRKDIAKGLDVAENKLLRTLDVLENMVRVETQGMRRGQIRILVHPAFVFKYEGSLLQQARQAAETHWVKTLPRTEGETDESVTPVPVFSKEFDDWLDSFGKGVAKKNEKWRKDKEGQIEVPTYSEPNGLQE